MPCRGTPWQAISKPSLLKRIGVVLSQLTLHSTSSRGCKGCPLRYGRFDDAPRAAGLPGDAGHSHLGCDHSLDERDRVSPKALKDLAIKRAYRDLRTCTLRLPTPDRTLETVRKTMLGLTTT